MKRGFQIRFFLHDVLNWFILNTYISGISICIWNNERMERLVATDVLKIQNK